MPLIEPSLLGDEGVSKKSPDAIYANVDTITFYTKWSSYLFCSLFECSQVACSGSATRELQIIAHGATSTRGVIFFPERILGNSKFYGEFEHMVANVGKLATTNLSFKHQ